jgi:hypothetical protein
VTAVTMMCSTTKVTRTGRLAFQRLTVQCYGRTASRRTGVRGRVDNDQHLPWIKIDLSAICRSIGDAVSLPSPHFT